MVILSSDEKIIRRMSAESGIRKEGIGDANEYSLLFEQRDGNQSMTEN